MSRIKCRWMRTSFWTGGGGGKCWGIGRVGLLNRAVSLLIPDLDFLIIWGIRVYFGSSSFIDVYFYDFSDFRARLAILSYFSLSVGLLLDFSLISLLQIFLNSNSVSTSSKSSPSS